MTIRKGRGRLTKDLLRGLLQELYEQYFDGETLPAKRAVQAVSQSEVARWLHAQGMVAADPGIPPLKKLTTINTALLGKLDELGLRTFFTEARSDHITTSLLTYFINTDADTYHASLRERVTTYIWKTLEISPDDDRDDVRRAKDGIDKALLRLRFGDIDAYKAQALLVFHIGWLAHVQGTPYKPLVTAMPDIETHMWGLISPYHAES